MNFLIFQLQRLLMLPVRLVTSPMELFSALSGEEGRSSALVKGLPAILIAAFGTIAVAAVSLGGKGSLIDHYSEELRKTNHEQEILRDDIKQSIMGQKSLGSLADGSDVNSLPEDDPRTKQYKELDDKAKIYLEKLVELEPEQQKFKYQMALKAFVAGDKAKCFSLLNQIAPLDTAGYPKAHLQMARQYRNLPVRTRLQKVANIDAALKHIEHCLTNDMNNLEALKMKADLLTQKGSRKDALETYKKVFAQDPKFFVPLLRLQPDENDRQSTLATASTKFAEQLKSSEVQEDARQWVPAWQSYAQAMLMRKEFEVLEKRLLLELDRYKESSDNLARVPQLTQHLAQLYISWAITEIGNPLQTDISTFTEADQLSLLDYFSKAKFYDENNRLVLQVVARLAFSPHESVVAKAKEIYDPELQDRLPSEVLNQLGSQALSIKDYKMAQSYYERARTQSPDSPAILNNLAYAYLQGEDEGDFSTAGSRRKKSNAERAHDLVKQAMRLLPANQRNSPDMSRYRHTLGTALMQLKNYPAAAAEFETALKIRPDDVELLESVVNCYDSFNLDSTAFRNRIAQLESEQEPSP